MIEGSDKLDISSCGAMKPISGFDGQTQLDLVRNPNYDPRTDSTQGPGEQPRPLRVHRQHQPRRHLQQDRARASSRTSTRRRRRRCSASTRRTRASGSTCKSNSGDRTYYITMNLTQPPFDDVHVRRAMNWVMDRNGAPQGVGRPGRRRRRRAHHPELDARREAERLLTRSRRRATAGTSRRRRPR